MLILFFYETTIYLRMFFIYPQNREISGEINMGIYIIGKSKKINSKKSKSIFYKTVKQK